MAVFTRIVAVVAGVSAFGLLLTAVSFQWLDAANSNEAVLGLAIALAAGNFYLLRKGMNWAAARDFAASPAESRRVRTAAPLGFPATN